MVRKFGFATRVVFGFSIFESIFDPKSKIFTVLSCIKQHFNFPLRPSFSTLPCDHFHGSGRYCCLGSDRIFNLSEKLRQFYNPLRMDSACIPEVPHTSTNVDKKGQICLIKSCPILLRFKPNAMYHLFFRVVHNPVRILMHNSSMTQEKYVESP